MKNPYLRLISVGRDTWKQMKDAQLFLVASSLAYTTILSIIPLLALSFAVFHAFGGMNKLYETIEPLIVSNLAEGTSEEAIQALHRFIDNAHTNIIGVGGLFGVIMTSMSMLSSIEKAINQVWQAKLNRSYFQRIAYYWFFITLGPLAMAVAVGTATSSDYPILKLFPSGTSMFMVTIGLFFMVYKWVPNCRVHWKYALFPAILTSILINLARISYRLYTAKNVSYQNIYGSLGAIPIFLLWIYIVWIIVLTGAALSAALQKRLEHR